MKKFKSIVSILLIALCLTTTLETSTLTVHAETTTTTGKGQSNTDVKHKDTKPTTDTGKADKESPTGQKNETNPSNNNGSSSENTGNTTTGANATGDGNSSATIGTTTGIENGASEARCGYRFYIVDRYANSVSSCAVDLLTKPVENPTTYFPDNRTRICNDLKATKQKIMPAGMPIPYVYQDSKFIGNGQALRDWAISINSETGNANIVDLIGYAFGDTEGSEGKQIADNWVANQDRYYAVLEPITWHGFFTGGTSDTYMTTKPSYSFGYTNMYGTFYNWYNAYKDVPLSLGNFTAVLDMFVLGTCMTLERDTDFEVFSEEDGVAYKLAKPTFSPDREIDKRIGNAGKELNNLGFGIHLYMNVETADNQTTYDENQGDTPAEPADESKGSYTIVKNYRYSEDDGATFNEGGCFNITFISENIAIEDEVSYRVVGWKITDSTETEIKDSTKWETLVQGDVKKSGTTSGHVKIEDGGRTL